MNIIKSQCKNIDNVHIGFSKEKKESLFHAINTSLDAIARIKKVTKDTELYFEKFQTRIKKCFVSLEACVKIKEKTQFDKVVSKTNKVVIRKLQEWKMKHFPKKEDSITTLLQSCAHYHSIQKYDPKRAINQEDEQWCHSVDNIVAAVQGKKNHFAPHGPYYIAEVIGVSKAAFHKHNDPRKREHIYAVEIRSYFDSWLQKKNSKGICYCIDMSFDQYMEKKIVPHLDKGKLQNLRRKSVVFCNEKERSQFAVSFKEGRPLIKGRSLQDGNYMFVLSPENTMYVGKKVVGRFHHSSFLSGNNVKSAGTILVKDGKIQKMTAQSGHYRPTKRALDVMKEFLKRHSRLGSKVKSISFV